MSDAKLEPRCIMCGGVRNDHGFNAICGSFISDEITPMDEMRAKLQAAEAQLAAAREALDVLEREIGGCEFRGPHGRTTVGDFIRAALASAAPGET